jgi:hypothetical protein
MWLERELGTYQEKLPELATQEGRFVLIHGDQVVDTFSTYEDALRQGYREFGLQPFLVKQIQVVEQVHFVTRAILPHRST